MDVGSLIRQLRKQRGLTLKQLADLTTNPATGRPTHLATIQKFERGLRDLDANWREALSRALGVDPSELTGASIPARPVRRVPLVGRIAAGNWREAIEDATDLIPTTLGGPNTFALIPDGDSMDRIVPPNGVIFCDPDERDLRTGRYYAVMTATGEVTFKQYLDKPPRLAPCSSNPDHKEMLIGAEPMTVIGRIIGQQSAL